MTQATLVSGYEVVIGFETHIHLATRSKLFSRSSTAFGAAPNTQASPGDLAMPGTLPVMNREAVVCAIKLGLALGSTVAECSSFDRKHYFYPDLPSGYQLSQFYRPVVVGGSLPILVGEQKSSVQLVRAHLEVDAGKSLHDAFQGQTGIDLNRAGTPLLEIVTEPCMRSSAEAVAYARELHKLVTWIGICDGNMQEGSFRCDANISVRRPGQPLGTRREIKNLNSFRNMQQALDYEISWQIDQLDAGQAIAQATVLFDADTGETRAMRSKEQAADYRYTPDPNLPPLHISRQWVEEVRATMPELPQQMVTRLMSEYELPEYDAVTLTQTPAMAAYFETAARSCGQAKLASNWVMGEVSRRLNAEEIGIASVRVSATQLAQLITRIEDATISNAAARKVFEALWDEGGEVDSIIEAKGLRQMNDAGALEKIVGEVIAANTRNVEQYKAGKDKAFNALVGQVMKATRGKANPAQVNELLHQKLDA